MVDPTSNRGELDFDIMSYVYLLLKHMWLIGLFVILAFGTAVFIGMTKVPMYRSTGLLKLEHVQNDIVSFGEQYDPWGFLRREFMNTELMILKSEPVAEQVVKAKGLAFFGDLFNIQDTSLLALIKNETEPDGSEQERLDSLQKRAVGFLRGGVEVQEIRNSNLIKVSFASDDPVTAKEMAEAWVQAYIEFGLEVDYEKNLQAYSFLESQAMDLQARIDELGARLAEYSKEKDIFAVSKDVLVVNESLSKLNDALVAAETELIEAKSYYERLQNSSPSQLEEVEKNPLVKSIAMDLVQKRSQYESDLKIYQPEIKRMQAARSKIQALEKQLNAERYKNHRQLLSSAEMRIQESTRDVEQLRENFDAQKRETVDLSLGAKTGWDTLQAEMEVLRRHLEIVDRRKQEVGMAMSLRKISRSNKTLIQSPKVPTGHFSPSKRKHGLVGIVIGILLSIVAIFLIEFTDRNIHSVEELESLSGLTCLATIPSVADREVKEKRRLQSVPIIRDLIARGQEPKVNELEDQKSRERVSLTSFVRPTSSIAEAYRHLRTSIQLSNTDGSRVFVLTSSISREGKTVTSTNLATSFAQMDKKVVLVDCDLRRPKMHHIFGFDKETGIVNFIVGQKPLDQVIRKTKVPNLDVICAGPIPPNPTELLCAQSLQDGIESLKARYDYIFIDSAPMLAVADASVVGNLGDKIIFVCKASSTTKDELMSAMTLCDKNKIKPLGVIFNDFDYGKALGKYGYRYRYRYKGYHYSTYRYRADEKG